jgi:hypothetical protein
VVLVMRRPGPRMGEELVLHVWRARVRLGDGSPLWLGSAQAMRYTRVLDAVGLWQPVPDGGAAGAAVRAALSGFPARSDEREGIPVLRVDARGVAVPIARPAPRPTR